MELRTVGHSYMRHEIRRYNTTTWLRYSVEGLSTLASSGRGSSAKRVICSTDKVVVGKGDVDRSM